MVAMEEDCNSLSSYYFFPLPLVNASSVSLRTEKHSFISSLDPPPSDYDPLSGRPHGFLKDLFDTKSASKGGITPSRTDSLLWSESSTPDAL